MRITRASVKKLPGNYKLVKLNYQLKAIDLTSDVNARIDDTPIEHPIAKKSKTKGNSKKTKKLDRKSGKMRKPAAKKKSTLQKGHTRSNTRKQCIVQVTMKNTVTTVATAVAPSNKSEKTYAFADSETKKVFKYITLETTNKDLSEIFNEQKRRKSGNFPPLTLYEIINKMNRKGVSSHFRKMESDEATPLHAESRSYQLMKGKDFKDRKIHELEGKENKFKTPSCATLRYTHDALKQLLHEDCESFDSVSVANSYYEYWRPLKPKVILLAESHVSTPVQYSCDGPIFDKSLLGNDAAYDGPLDFCSLVYCLGYGENDVLKPVGGRKTKVIPRLENLGTWQFWNLLEACVSAAPDGDPKNFGKDLLKSSKLSPTERIQRKFQILTEMKNKGIWLLDTSIIGWYIPQNTPYDIAKKSKQVTKLPNIRPHPKLKKPCLLMSWEGHVKHLVRKAAEDGELKLFIPIGKDVATAIGKDRFLDAVSGSEATVVEAYPAPNARIEGGYSTQLGKISNLLQEI